MWISTEKSDGIYRISYIGKETIYNILYIMFKVLKKKVKMLPYKVLYIWFCGSSQKTAMGYINCLIYVKMLIYNVDI